MAAYRAGIKTVIIPKENQPDLADFDKAVLDAEMEEERRMFYVGMTRAREKLELYFIRERFGKEKQPSRFLEELKEGPDEE